MRTIPSRLLTSILVIVAVFGLGGSRLSPIPAHAQEEGAFFPIHVLACDAFVKYQGSAAGFGYPPECRGLEGITVTAYDTEGVELDDCTTGAEGNCMLAISYNGVRIYRMETDNVPEGYRAESDVQRLFTYTEFGEVTFHTYSEAAFPQRDAPRATVRVHSRVCPENYAGDTFFEDCHDNLPKTNQWIFSSEGYARTGTDGDALLRYAPAGNDTQIIGGQSYLTGDIFFFCSLTDDPSVEIPTTVEVTALYDGITRDFVGRLDLEPQSDVTCDWYQVPFLDRGLWDTVINPLAGEGASDVFAEGTGSLELYLYRCPDGVLPETALEGAEQCTSREHTATVHATTEDGTEYASGTTDAEGHVTLAMDGEAVVPIWLTLDGHASSERDVLMCAANRSQPGGSTDPLYQGTVIDGAAWSIPGLGDDLGGVICSWYLVPTGS